MLLLAVRTEDFTTAFTRSRSRCTCSETRERKHRAHIRLRQFDSARMRRASAATGGDSPAAAAAQVGHAGCPPARPERAAGQHRASSRSSQRGALVAIRRLAQAATPVMGAAGCGRPTNARTLQARSAPLPCVARQGSRVVMHWSTISSSGMLPSMPQQATSRDRTRRSRLEARHGCAAVPPPPLPSLPPLPPSSRLCSSSNHGGGSKKASSMTGRASWSRTPSAAPPSRGRAPRSCQRSWFTWGNSTIRPRAFSRSSLRHGSSGCQRQGSRRRPGGGCATHSSAAVVSCPCTALITRSGKPYTSFVARSRSPTVKFECPIQLVLIGRHRGHHI